MESRDIPPDKLPDITAKQLIKTVLKLGEDRPDNVYSKPEDSDFCHYDRGKCTDGSTGCIMGQALRQLGVEATLNGAIDTLLTMLDVQMTEAERTALVDVQQRQDLEIPWGTAITKLRRFNYKKES